MGSTRMNDKYRSITIFGINYWPEHTGNAPYTTGLAEYLAQTGWNVTVVAGLPHYPSWSVPLEYRHRTLTETVNGVTVHHRWHYVPQRQSAFRRALWELSFFSHGAVTTPKSKPDVILGIAPSVSGALLAATYSKRTKRPYGVLFQDLSGAAASQSGTPGGAKVAGVVSKMESVAVRNAAAVGIVADGFRAHLHELGIDDDRIHRVRNWNNAYPPTQDRQTTRATFGWYDDTWVVLHAGNMGYKQGLENVIDAARLAQHDPNSPLFVFMGDGNQREHLVQYAAGLRNVQFVPTQPIDSGYPNALMAADTLLVNQRSTVMEMCLPSKLCSYLASGTPIVAAVALESETARELALAQSGTVVPHGDPAQLLSAISQIQSAPAIHREISARGLAYATSQLTATASFAAADRFISAIATAERNTQMNIFPAH